MSFSVAIARFGLAAKDLGDTRILRLLRHKIQLDKRIKASREDGTLYANEPELMKRFGLTPADLERDAVRFLVKAVLDSEFYLRGSGQ